MRRLLLLLVSAVCLAARQESGAQLAWELKLRTLAADASRAPQDVLALRFSPDGEQIAAVVSRITQEGEGNELLLIAAHGSAPSARRLRFHETILSSAEHPGIHWSPRGDYLAVEFQKSRTRIIRLADETQCELPRTSVFGGFFGPDLAVAADWEPPKDPASLPIDSSSVTLYGTDCKAVDTWKVPGQVRDLEPSPAAGLMALSPEHSGVRIIRRASALETAHVAEPSGRVLRFGEKGTVLCTGGYGERGSLVCTEIEGGHRFVYPELLGGAPFDVSRDAAVVLATQSAYSNAASDEGQRGFSAWVVWNYRTGRELARVRYQKQKHAYAVSPSAIAPGGGSFVVGVRGAIRLYKIAPA